MVTRKNAPVSKSHGSTTAIADRPAKPKMPEREPLKVGEITDLEWFNLHAFQERNTRKDSFGKPLGDLGEVIRPLKEGETNDDRGVGGTGQPLVGQLFGGWDSVKGSVEVTLPTKADVDLAIQQRREQLAAWRSIDDEHRSLADFVEGYWFPKGEPAPILAIANMSYRRTFALPAVVYARYRRGVEKTGHFTVPVVVMKYADELTAFTRHVMENDKDSGRAKYSERDWLLVAKRLMALNPKANEASLVRLGCKRGAAQKVWRFALLDAQQPAANLYERAMMSPIPSVDPATGQYLYAAPNPNGLTNAERIGSYIPLERIDKEDLQALLTDKDYRQRPLEAAKTRVTGPKVLEEYVSHKVLGGKSVVAWNKNYSKRVQAFKGTELFRFVGWCLATSNIDALEYVDSTYADAINKAMKDVDFVALREAAGAEGDESLAEKYAAAVEKKNDEE